MLQWAVPDDEAALASLRQAEQCYGSTQDGVRVVLHRSQILKAEGKNGRGAGAGGEDAAGGSDSTAWRCCGRRSGCRPPIRKMKLAERYGALRPAAGSIREELIAEGAPPEIELQARWFSGEFGREFRTVDGRAVRVIQFGVWNREAGPDFAEAAISIDGGEPLSGAIELDSDARDWERHGHAANAAYEQVVLHLFFQSGGVTAFCRTLSNRAVPQVQLDLRAAAGAAAESGAAGLPGPMRRAVEGPGPGDGARGPRRRGAIPDAAESGPARPAAGGAWRGRGIVPGAGETLGYKSNKLPFALLSQRAPVRILRRTGEIDALLFGVAGFLKPEDFPPPRRQRKRICARCGRNGGRSARNGRVWPSPQSYGKTAASAP